MDGESQGETPPKIVFIRDEPAEADFFQSHDRLASTLASVVENQPELRVIGLLGDWGSGKSTVVRLMKKRLDDDTNAPKIHCFEYDTWLHQSDPPRRAFLETLIHFLISQELTTYSEWQERLDELSGRILKEAEPTSQVGSNLAEALNSLVSDMVGHADSAFRANWFKAIDLLSSAGRGVALRKLRDWMAAAGNPIGDLTTLLGFVDGRLTAIGGFRKQEDGAVRNIAIPLLSVSDGLEWLEANAEEVRFWINGASAETKDYLTERVGDLARTGGDDQTERLEALAKAWNLTLPPSNEQDQGTDGGTKEPVT